MKHTIQDYIERFHMQEFMSDNLLQHLEIVHYKRGEHVMRAGTRLMDILFIVDGKAKTLYVTHNGMNTLHSFLQPFMIIGDVEFFKEHEVINDVIAICDMDCLKLSLVYKEQMCKDERFIYTLAMYLSDKLIRSNHNKSISLTYPVESRLASYICASAQQLIFSQNLQDGAEMIGCSYRQLQRILQKFVKLHLIEKQGKGVYRIVKEKELLALGNDIYVF